MTWLVLIVGIVIGGVAVGAALVAWFVWTWKDPW